MNLQSPKINFIRTGPRGGIPVVLVHAVGMDLTMWGYQIEVLQKLYDVAALDLPGHGLSYRLDSEPSFSIFSAALILFIESLGTVPVHLVGISFGGMVVQTLAIQRPDLVCSLSLIGTACDFSEPVRLALRERARFVRNEGMQAVAPLTLVRWFTHEFSERRPDVIDLITKILCQQEPSFHAAIWDVISTLNTLTQLKEISVPACIIVGEKDTSTPIASAQILANALRTEKLYILPNASHFTNIEAPEAVNSILISFFASFGITYKIYEEAKT